MPNLKIEKQLKKLLRLNRFRFVIILYDTINDIKNIKTFIKDEYKDTKHLTLDIKNKKYNQLSKDIYNQNSFIYIDDFSDVLELSEFYHPFNQRRDKIASYSINLIVFYPKKLQDKLYSDALELIPDLWEFRTGVIECDSEEISDNLNIEKDYSAEEYSGMNKEEKHLEILRLENKLKIKKTKEQEAYLYNDLAFLYKELGEYNKALSLCKKSLEINKEVFGENHP
ncbi:MAG: tetratricopeptide repeat protein, partial [Campylobacterota bacterium]|nr:tetratricopeptide repeat protein [Campylobacterota bacterium]